MMEVKPCKKCGCTFVDVICMKDGILWGCLVGCFKVVCEEKVVRFGLTKRQAERRAMRAWNRRNR